MRRSLWLVAATALALAACDRHKGPAGSAPKPLKAAAAAPGAPPRPGARVASAPPAATRAGSLGAAVARGGAQAGRVHAASLHKASLHKARPRPAFGVVGRSDPYSTSALASEGAGPSGALASAETGYSADYQDCVVAANGFTVARADCRSAELARQGGRLGHAYDTAAANRSPSQRARLQARQQDWASRRDAGCREQAGRGGADLLEEGSCRLDMTIKRANGLAREAG